MNIFRTLVLRSQILKHLAFILRNKLTIGDNSFQATNIHFKNNIIDMRRGKKQSLLCEATSFLRDCSVLMVGRENLVSVKKGTEVYGENGQAFHIDGNNNQVIIGENSSIRNTVFYISGNNNRIILSDDISCYGAEFHLRQDNNQIVIGKGTSFHGRNGYPVHIVGDEGRNIIIGDDCMFSKDIQIRSSDSHNIVDSSGHRLNPAEDVFIGDHVWISMGATLLKGTWIPSHSVIAAGAVCTSKYLEENSIIAGNPARVVKKQVDWDRKYL